jgi:formate-dependent phosphoribosylglycinamide formyltransferase (GAR transformylase)
MPTARLGIALSQTGSYVDAVCPANHLIRKSSILRKGYTYRALSPLSSFRNAISASHPDLIVSADDLSTQHLIDLHAQGGTELCGLIERSLGPPESFPFMTARASFMNIAREEGIVVPNTTVIRDMADLQALESTKGFPIVLKSDGSSSGEGTKVAHNFLEAQRAYQFLQRSPSLLRIVKRVLINHDLRSVRLKLRRRAIVNMQKYIRGRDATSLIACWKGEVLGALHFEVIEKQYAFGPASVMKLINNAEIETFAARIVKKLKLSGLHGFDFLLEEQTGLPYMIEFNPRATQVGHLTLGAGRDLPGAIHAAVTGTARRESPRLTDNPTIALFPQEFMRDPESPFLQSSYHDIPRDEPELTRACLRQGQKSHTQHFIEACLRIVHPNYRLLL